MCILLKVFLLSFLLMACNQEKQSQYASASTSAEPLLAPAVMEETAGTEMYAENTNVSAEKSEVNAADQLKAEPKIIKNANVRFQVKDLPESIVALKTIARNFGGYVASSNEVRSNYEYTTQMTIRVQSTRFEALLDELLKQAIYVNTNNVSSQDVTEEFVDIESRLKTKREVEQRYIAILQQAKTIEDILKVEAQLRQIREEIEAKEGRLQFLKDRVSYSTITLEAYQLIQTKPAPEFTVSFFTQIKEAFISGGKGLLDFIVTLVYIWPVFLVVITAYWGYRIWSVRRIKPEQTKM